ncbi:metallophosphoesterase [Geobacter hydrogenophilus]|uniref:Serine/threonine phosphatase n=1 Tax=Geobacter hydrogenophilus TaxID=40983 RepID=A0A9W6LBK9_9BACT|nr:metallophosphoesterase [Geobacter hydrogenophilus]MBT0894000.1 metallophosphoesterase [Geobacter hydrogenophilus]GLI38053.1 serine/threonine phosphatase [Geobacter hydrogenophilus]
MNLFLLVFFLVYGGTHAYFFIKARGAFGFGPSIGAPLALFLALMALAPVLVRITERHGWEFTARFLAWTGYLWMGLLFFFFSASLAMDLFHLVLKGGGALLQRDPSLLIIGKRAAFGIAAAYAVLACLSSSMEAGHIRSRRIVIPTTKLPATIPKLTIAQISDVHLGLIVRKERLENILAKVREARPDIVVSTGDLVDGQINDLSALEKPLAELSPRYGKFAVTGNHEVYVGLDQAIAFTRRGGFTVLRGEGVTAGGVVNIAGVDDPATPSPPHAERNVLAGLPADRFTILLKHRPRIDGETVGRFDLQLSGHVHGGQLFPFGLLVRLSYPYMDGFYRLANGSALSVSRGSGTWGPPLRFLAPPEVTIIELIPFG